jgi:hypothetical protein
MSESAGQPLEGHVAPSETEESIRLSELKRPVQPGTLGPGMDHSISLFTHHHIITSHERLASPIAGSVPSGNR